MQLVWLSGQSLFGWNHYQQCLCPDCTQSGRCHHESGGETTPLGTNTITFLGHPPCNAKLGRADDSAHAGIYSTPINVPTGQTGTFLTAGRMTVGGNLTGGGTFNLGVSSVRGEITCNFGAFTGQINVFPNGTADFRVENTNGFPLASLYLEPM